MKLEKSYDLLNSEGPLIKIQKIGGLWHYQFNGNKTHLITSIKEILGSLIEGKGIIDRANGRIYFLNDYPISMKGDSPAYYESIIKDLISEELEKCKKDHEYFKKIYLCK